MIRFFASHPVAANLCMLVMVAIGLWGIKNLNKQIDPDITIHSVIINIRWPGATAEDVEQRVTKPLEYALRGMDYLKSINSISYHGRVKAILQFTEEANINTTIDNIKGRVDDIRNFPNDLKSIEIRQEIRKEPIASILVSARRPIDELIPIIRKFESQLRERGIDEITLSGLPNQEISIEVKPQALYQLGIGIDELSERILQQNTSMPLGPMGYGEDERFIRGYQSHQDVSSFEKLLITMGPGNQMVQLGDIANIQFSPIRGQMALFHNGMNAIEIHLRRNSTTDSLDAAKKTHEWYEDIRDELDSDIAVKIIKERWHHIGNQISVMLANGAGGMLLVFLSLLLFLHARVSWWVMMGIPVSFLFALGLLNAAGGSINLTSLVAFILALGVVVDDAIVVSEHTAVKFNQGMTPLDAAVNGAKWMALPVFASSLTTIATLLPSLLIGGPLGQVITTIPIVMICVIIGSLIECFLILPNHLSSSLPAMKKTSGLSPHLWFEPKFELFKQQIFRPFLVWCIDNRLLILPLIFSIFITSLFMVISTHIKVDLAIGFTPEYLSVDMKNTQLATHIERENFYQLLEKTLDETAAEFGDNLIVANTLKLGQATFSRQYKLGELYASMDVELIPPDEREPYFSSKEFLDKWREKVAVPPHVQQLSFSTSGGVAAGKPPIHFLVQGDSLDKVRNASESIVKILNTFAGTYNIATDLNSLQYQLIVKLTAYGKSLGLTSSNIGRQLNDAIKGRIIQIINKGEEEVEVRVALEQDLNRGSLDLERYPISVNGTLLPLDTVAETYYGEAVESIRREDAKLTVAVTAFVDTDVANAREIVQTIQREWADSIESKYDVSIGLGQEARDREEQFEKLKLGGLVAIVFIYAVLAWTFSSYLWPLAIMTAIPLSLIGVIWGHWLMGINLTVMSFLGCFALAGIVVNDSIILISFYRELRESGVSIENAVLESSCQRLRAVVLTSVTTIAGLLTLFFEGSQFAEFVLPMPVTICFGLLFSTVLVLVVTPLLLITLEKAQLYIAENLRGKRSGNE